MPLSTLYKAIAIVKCFSYQQKELKGVEIGKIVGMNKATLYRFLSVMSESGLLEKNTINGKYRIGPLFFSFGNLYISTTDILSAAEPVVSIINELTNESVSVAILDKGYVTIVLRREASKHPFRWAIHQGSVFPAYASGLGLALLSTLTDEEIDMLYPSPKLKKITPKTIETKTKLKHILNQIRISGFARSSEQSVEDVDSVASPIRDASGKSIASMSIQIPIIRMNKQKAEVLGTLVKMAASLVSYKLGYQSNDNSIFDIDNIKAWWKQNKIE